MGDADCWRPWQRPANHPCTHAGRSPARDRRLGYRR